MNKNARIARERLTIRRMIELACRGRHRQGRELCPECRELLDYAWTRLERCRFGAAKPTCARCPVHCYKPAMREKVREVMRYAGPRMLLRHPVLAVCHLLDGLRRVPPARKAR
jgi:predicted amidophosphoribosyltransferase